MAELAYAKVSKTFGPQQPVWVQLPPTAPFLKYPFLRYNVGNLSQTDLKRGEKDGEEKRNFAGSEKAKGTLCSSYYWWVSSCSIKDSKGFVLTKHCAKNFMN